MKKLTSLLLFAAVLTSFKANSQSEAEMKAWMDYMTPGEVHKMLAKTSGKWKTEITMWMQPGAEPTKTTGAYTAEMILGGRYLQEKHTGDMMGMPFEGVALTSYDNAKKTYSVVWVDNMGTGMMFMEGKWDEKKGLELKGKTTDPMTGKDMNVRQVMKFIDDNNSVMEMYMTHEGKEFKTMEVKSSRM
jgi:hypothetical protein